MNTKNCGNCFDGRTLNTESLKIAFPDCVLCINGQRSKDAVVKHKFCYKKAYVKIGEYPCFRSGGFD